MSLFLTAERRKLDRDGRKAVEEIWLESSFANTFVEADPNSRRRASRPRASDSLAPIGRTAPSSTNARELHLDGWRELAHLVEKQGARVCELERAGATRNGTRVRAAPMPEKLGIRERVGKRARIERHVRARTPAQRVQRLRDTSLPLPDSPWKQHGGSRARVPRNLTAYLSHRKRPADEGRDRRPVVRHRRRRAAFECVTLVWPITKLVPSPHSKSEASRAPPSRTPFFDPRSDTSTPPSRRVARRSVARSRRGRTAEGPAAGPLPRTSCSPASRRTTSERLG